MTTTTPIDPTKVADGWTRMWNRETPADQIVAAQAMVHFGRTPPSPRPVTTTGPGELQNVVNGIGDAVPGVVYATQGQPLLDESGTRVTIVWNVRADEIEPRTGIDVLLVEGDHITEVWSVTGDLELPALR